MFTKGKALCSVLYMWHVTTQLQQLSGKCVYCLQVEHEETPAKRLNSSPDMKLGFKSLPWAHSS
jgi:hypothetical protein